MKKAVVIGGSGFIGSHVADELSASGFRTTIFDSSCSNWLKVGQEMIKGDIQDLKAVRDVVKDAEVVYNFAALSDLNDALRKPFQTLNINVIGNLNVLEACRLENVKRFIYASTIYVHSREGGFYRCSKQASESYVEEFKRTYDLDYTILRYGSLYGPRSDDSNGMRQIIKNALLNRKLSYNGHKDSMREYIHVADAAKASIVALGDEFKNESVVLTGHEPMKVLDVLKMLGEILGLPESAIEFFDGEYEGHYIRTPYAYQPKLGRKYIPPMHVDLGQGILQVINEVEKIIK
jgi:UDP-glucose 4-epimerase